MIFIMTVCQRWVGLHLDPKARSYSRLFLILAHWAFIIVNVLHNHHPATPCAHSIRNKTANLHNYHTDSSTVIAAKLDRILELAIMSTMVITMRLKMLLIEGLVEDMDRH